MKTKDVEPIDRWDAEAWMGENKDIWDHPSVIDRNNKESYEVADIMAEFANTNIKQLINKQRMNVYRIFTSEKSLSQFGYSAIKSVIVIANNEQDAINIVKENHKDDFACKFDKVICEIIRENINEPMIIAINYQGDEF